MPIPHETPVPSDSRRDAERYSRVLLALKHATWEIRRVEKNGRLDIDGLLDRLLPDLAAALDAEQAFVAMLQEDEDGGKKWFQLTAAYPRKDLRRCHLEWSELLDRLIKDGITRVIDPLGDERQDPVPGLEIFDATSAVLVRMQTPDHVRVVGMCNKADPYRGPFLAADGVALDSIVELVAIGARVGERRRRELEGIQKTSAAISAELELDGLLPMIAGRAAEVFGAPATSLMLLDGSGEILAIKASWGLSDEYVQQQRISREKARTVISPSGKFLPFAVEDLRLRPFGRVEQIERERLCSVLVVPLVVSDDEPIGALNIYSKDTPRQFTQDEKELARIFANQAVIAIQNAQVYQQVTKRAKAMESLEKVGRIITADLDLRHVLRLIVENANKVLEADISTVFFLDESTKQWFPFGLGNLHGTIQTLPPEWMPKSKGLAARVVKDKKLLVVEDVASRELAAKSKIVITEEIRSFACCPLLAGEDALGLLYIDFCTLHRFTSDELQTIQMLANQAAIAIKNAMQYEDIEQAYTDAERIRGELAATEAVAWMGILGSSWSHGVNQKSFAIRNYVEVLRALVPLEPKVEEVLSQIEAAADDVKNIPITQPLPTTPGTSHGVVEIDDALRKQVQKWCRPRQDVHVQFDLHCPHVQTQIDREWLEVALEKLVSNALKAMSDGGTLTVSSEQAGEQVRVHLADTGHGIPDYAREHFLKDRIPKEDGSGTGVGVLIARLIFRRYGGELSLLWTEPGSGTALEILLPVESASSQT